MSHRHRPITPVEPPAVGGGNRAAFTLVELLVVAGILALLIALLMPALAVARQHADRVACAANLRSIGQALVMYTQRWGCYPGESAEPAGAQFGGVAAWPPLLREYMGGSRNAFYCPAQLDRCRWDGDGPAERPGSYWNAGARADAPYTALGYEPGERLLHSGVYFSYGYNTWGAGMRPLRHGLGQLAITSPLPDSVVLNFAGVRVGRVKTPSDMVAVTDSNADGFGDWEVTPHVAPTAPHPPYFLVGRPHRGGTNVLFCDGHVTWYPPEELLVEFNTATPENLRKSRRWNWDHEP